MVASMQRKLCKYRSHIPLCAHVKMRRIDTISMISGRILAIKASTAVTKTVVIL